MLRLREVAPHMLMLDLNLQTQYFNLILVGIRIFKTFQTTILEMLL